MFELKPLHGAIGPALEKAHRYRLLNEPGEAESICQDVLALEPENQQALVTLLLALTDQFERDLAGQLPRAREVLARLRGEYEQLYYAGVVSERRAKALLRQGRPGAGPHAYQFFREAMDLFEKADAIRPPDNDDATLRWNACARKIMNNPELRQRSEEPYEPELE